MANTGKRGSDSLALVAPTGTIRRHLWNSKTLILMCLPAIAFFTIFNYIPMPGVYIAFTNFNYQAGIFGSEFVGFDNFRFLTNNGKLMQLTIHTVLYNVTFIILGNALQIAIAIMLNEVRKKWFRRVTQSMMFLPFFISHVIVGLLFFNFLNSDYGVIPRTVQALGGENPGFYSNPQVWPAIIVIANLWKETGYGTIVYFAAICAIDTAMMEAAEIDGCNAWQRIRFVLLPNLKPTIIILMLFALGGVMRGNFGLFYNLVGSANAPLLQYTDIIEMFVFRSLMNQFNFASASAVGLYQSVFGLIIILTVNGIVKKIEPDYALF